MVLLIIMPVPNVIKYSITNVSDTLKKGNLYIGVTDRDYGPTEVTGFYNGVSVTGSNFLTYVADGSGNLSYNIASNQDQLLSFISSRAGVNFATFSSAVVWSITQSNISIANKNLGNIATNGLVVNYDANWLMSYPLSGTTFYNTTGLQNSTLTNGPVFNATSSTFLFDGTNDRLNVTTSTFSGAFEFGLHWDPSWTFEFWMRPNKYGVQMYGHYTGSSEVGFPAVHQISFLDNYSGYYGSQADNSSTNISYTASTTFPLNSWSHYVLTMDSGRTMSLYRNGYVINRVASTFANDVGRNDSVYKIMIDSVNQKIWVAGGFRLYNGGFVGYGIIKLDTNGSRSSDFVGATFSGRILDMDLDSSNRPTVVGRFINFNGSTSYAGIRLNTTGTKSGFDPIFNYGLAKIKLDASGNAYVLAMLSTWSGGKHIMRLNTSGVWDTTFNATMSSFCSEVNIDSSGKILVGGDFTTVQGVSIGRIARLNTNGSLDSTFTASVGLNARPNVIREDSNGKIYVGGVFTAFNSVTNNRIIRLNSDGSKDTAFDNTTGFNAGVSDIEIDTSSGLIYVGGLFTTYKGVSASRIVRLTATGSIDSSFNTGSGFDGEVKTIAIDSTGKIYVGGSFFNYNGLSASGIIKLNSDGTQDTSFNYGSGFTRVSQRPPSNIATFLSDQTLATSHFGGDYGELRLYNRALSETEVFNNYRGTLTRYIGQDIVLNGLILYYDAGFSGSFVTSNNFWYDLSGLGNTGTLVNGPTFSSDNGGSIRFDGTNDQITLSSQPVLTNQVTLECWTQFNNVINATPPHYGIGFLAGRENGYRLLVSTAGFTWVCATTNNSWYSTGTTADYNVTAATSSWWHVVGTYDGSNNRIYVNGVLRATGSNISGNVLTGNQPFKIGYPGNLSPGVNTVLALNGRVAETRLYNRALTGSEILNNYNADKSRFGLS